MLNIKKKCVNILHHTKCSGRDVIAQIRFHIVPQNPDIGGHFVMSHKMNKSLVEDPQFQCLAHNAHPQARSDAYNKSSNPPNGIIWNQPK